MRYAETLAVASCSVSARSGTGLIISRNRTTAPHLYKESFWFCFCCCRGFVFPQFPPIHRVYSCFSCSHDSCISCFLIRDTGRSTILYGRSTVGDGEVHPFLPGGPQKHTGRSTKILRLLELSTRVGIPGGPLPLKPVRSSSIAHGRHTGRSTLYREVHLNPDSPSGTAFRHDNTEVLKWTSVYGHMPGWTSRYACS